MSEVHEIQLLIESHVPILVIESHEERRALGLFAQLALRLGKPAYAWSITEGLRRIDRSAEDGPQLATEPGAALGHIKLAREPAIYLLLDFHPYLDDPINVRLLKELAQRYEEAPNTIVLISHALVVPPELRRFVARFELSLPGPEQLGRIVEEEAVRYAATHGGRRVTAERASLELLIQNLRGVSAADARRLARKAIYNDGAITDADLPAVTRAKYEMLDMDGVLSFEYETAQLSEVGGLGSLKRWLDQRRDAFRGKSARRGLHPPKGILLLGVQGGGKSLAAKAVAGTWGVPLLRLDFGALYNKFFGESERNLRHALRVSEAMAPCVLWLDEVEKGVSGGEHDGGTSRRVLGTLLTWMAERKAAVFLVATANDLSELPPELLRKGRLDEIFFVDLPGPAVRAEIFSIHLRKRDLDPALFDLSLLTQASEGFSGAEVEQVVVAALYSSIARGVGPTTADLLAEIRRTQPLSVVMAEQVAELRSWAAGRTVPAA